MVFLGGLSSDTTKDVMIGDNPLKSLLEALYIALRLNAMKQRITWEKSTKPTYANSFIPEIGLDDYNSNWGMIIPLLTVDMGRDMPWVSSYLESML